MKFCKNNLTAHDQIHGRLVYLFSSIVKKGYCTISDRQASMLKIRYPYLINDLLCI